MEIVGSSQILPLNKIEEDFGRVPGGPAARSNSSPTELALNASGMLNLGAVGETVSPDVSLDVSLDVLADGAEDRGHGAPIRRWGPLGRLALAKNPSRDSQPARFLHNGMKTKQTSLLIAHD